MAGHRRRRPGRWTNGTGSPEQGPGQRQWAVAGKVPVDARARAILFSSIHLSLASGSGGSDPGRGRLPRPQHACAARPVARTRRIHGPPRRRSGHDHENISRRDDVAGGARATPRASTDEERNKPCRPRRRFRDGPLDESQGLSLSSRVDRPPVHLAAPPPVGQASNETAPVHHVPSPAEGQTCGHSASAVTALREPTCGCGCGC